MPIITGSSGTGSYYYPGLNVAQASYKSVDIRGSTDHQGTASGLGRLYVLSSSGDLYYLDPDGNQVVVASSATGSGENVFDNVYVSSSLLVKGDSVLSGNVVVGGQIYDLNSNLILSSAVGSVIAASGSLDFPQTDKAYHVRAVNSHLILSSSAGSVVALSASQDFVNSDKNYHIRAVNSHLILSSSAGSRVTVSGNIHLASSSSLLLDADGDTKIDGGSVNNTIVFYTGNSQRANLAAGGLTMASTRTIVMTNGSIYDGSGHLILSSTVGSVVALSASQDFANSDKTYHIRAVNSDLVLSSSATSVVALSSALDFQNIGNKNYTIVNRSGHLILSSSAGSQVTLSGTNFTMVDGGPSLLSGTLSVIRIRIDNNEPNTGFGKVSANTIGFFGNNTQVMRIASVGPIILNATPLFLGTAASAAASSRIAFETAQTPDALVVGVNTDSRNLIVAEQGDTTTDFAFPQQTNPTLTIQSSDATDVVQRLYIQHNQADGYIATDKGNLKLRPLSGSLILSAAFAGNTNITAQESHLILSSSVGSIIHASGALKLYNVAAANLPAGSDVVSGSIAWLTDAKFGVIYGPEGWSRILTGAVAP